MKEVLIVAALICSTTAAVVFSIAFVNNKACTSYGLITQRPAQYEFWSDTCYVSTVDHGWIPKDEFNKRAIGRE